MHYLLYFYFFKAIPAKSDIFMTLIAIEKIGNKQCHLRKDEQQYGARYEAYQEGIDPVVNISERCFGYILYHKNIDCHRRQDNPGHHGYRDHDPKPDGIITELDYGRIEHRGGQYHESKVVDERPAYEIDQAYQAQDHPGFKG
jgi:hypothetical protein